MIVDKHLGEVDELVTNLFSLRKNAIVFRLFAMALQDQDVKNLIVSIALSASPLNHESC